MASNSDGSVNSTSPTSFKVGRSRFQAAWNAFKAAINTHTATPATPTLDGIYVEVFDDMQTAVVNSKMEGNKKHVEQKPVTNLEKKIYDLNFLLELGKKESKAPLPLKFTNDAIKLNILKGSTRRKQKEPLARGVSNISKESVGSDAEELLFKRIEPKGSKEPEEPKEPCRQPKQPPDTPLAQIHAGFRRFLKEHASPSHSRVTAGGRIVPVGPHGSSPPSFNLSSIADAIHSQAPAQATSSQQEASTTNDGKEHSKENSKGHTSPVMENVPIAASHQESQGNPQQSEANFVTAQANKNQANVLVPGFPTPLPFGTQVLMKLAHGPTVVANDGVLYEAISDGPNTILAQLHGFQQGTPLAPAPIVPAFPMVSPMPMVAPMPIASMQPMPLMNVTNNVPIALNQPAVEVQRQALQKQLDDLRGELDQLDKYVALNRAQIGQLALSAVVAQRRQLVVQIDETRVIKENLDKPTQMNSHPSNAQMLQAPQGFGMGSTAANIQGQHFPGIGLPALAGGPHMYGAGFPVHAGPPVPNIAAHFRPSHGIDSDGWKAQQTYTNTDAQSWQQHSSGTTNPVFRSNHSATQSIPAGLEYGKDGWKAKEYNQQNFPGNLQGTVHEPTPFEYLSGEAWSYGHVPSQQLSNANGQGHNVTHNEYPTYHRSRGVAYGPAGKLPYVWDHEASYATRLGINPPNEPKRFCSTPAEFAAVMQQARDHARLHGRVGWSPNDDQDDAEEDIRWAMLDDRRIPLPKAVPDYVTNPQPYDFEAQYQKFFDELKNSGVSLEKVDREIKWKKAQEAKAKWEAANPTPRDYPINREHPVQAHVYAQAQAESRANQYRATYAQETTAPFSGPMNPASNQTTWAENGNGELTRQSKHAYVEDAPETPARYGFNHGSLSGRSGTSQQYPAVTNTWSLPTLDECEIDGKPKGSKANSVDSWSTKSDHQPEYMRVKWRFEIDGKEVTQEEERAHFFAQERAAKELAQKNTMNGQNDQKDFLRTMLRDPRHSSTDSQSKPHGARTEELRRLGLNAAGFPIHYPPASSFVNKENQRSGSYSDTQPFQNVMAREGERVGGMPQFGGPYSNTQQFQNHNVMAREGERIGGMPHFGGYKDSRVYKAGPSVAAPIYQARGHGYVPQYDGATDSVSSNTPASTEASSEASSRRSSEQVARAGTQVGSKVPMNAAAPSFFYEPVRRFPTSEGVHYEAVDKFFNTIREEERAEIAKYKAQFPLM